MYILNKSDESNNICEYTEQVDVHELITIPRLAKGREKEIKM